jgi:hypothetical protein
MGASEKSTVSSALRSVLPERTRSDQAIGRSCLALQHAVQWREFKSVLAQRNNLVVLETHRMG